MPNEDPQVLRESAKIRQYREQFSSSDYKNTGADLLRTEAQDLLKNPELTRKLRASLVEDTSLAPGCTITDVNGRTALEVTKDGLKQDFFGDGSSIVQSADLTITKDADNKATKFESGGRSISKHDDKNWYYHSETDKGRYEEVVNPERGGSINLQKGRVSSGPLWLSAAEMYIVGGQ